VPISKNRKKQQPIPVRKRAPLQLSSMQVSLGYDPKGKMEQRDVVSSKDGWTEYKLDDGSIIKVKAVILEIKRAVDQYNLEGNPIYVMQQTIISTVQAPDDLKKKD